MNFWKIPGERLIPLFVNRTVIFFFIMCVLTLFLYAAGTVQEFIDSTQLTLLNLYSVFGIILTVTAAFGVIMDLYRFTRAKKSRYIFRAGGYLLLVVFGVATVFAITVIITISGGSGS